VKSKGRKAGMAGKEVKVQVIGYGKWATGRQNRYKI